MHEYVSLATRDDDATPATTRAIAIIYIIYASTYWASSEEFLEIIKHQII